ncbi:unnamed protein product [Macrosiphum euphorbiae]|uniref:Uncharacterized protein n=1 Tax=Macrosiphum euphorbiae TaxID=13131 RepID=A0AAV0WRH6_9HEMI|nr:unnamed protein product [Macrosiphum euphorbiae]
MQAATSHPTTAASLSPPLHNIVVHVATQLPPKRHSRRRRRSWLHRKRVTTAAAASEEAFDEGVCVCVCCSRRRGVAAAASHWNCGPLPPKAKRRLRAPDPCNVFNDAWDKSHKSFFRNYRIYYRTRVCG